MFLSVPLYPSAAEEPTERILIMFKGSIDEQLLQQESIEINHVFESLSAVSATVPFSSIERLKNQPNIIKIEQDHEVVVNEQVENWGYDHVLAEQANTNGWTGKGVKVGIIDTGIRTDHPDLRVAGGISFVENSISYEDDEGHGTHVAGIIGALDNEIGTVGAAPESELYAIKSLNNEGNGNLSDVIAGIDWAIQNNLDVINLSLTSDTGSYFLELVLEEAYNRGILVIAASGNAYTALPSNVDVLYPARYGSVIAVGAVNSSNKKSTFSYFGPSLEFVAPGESIYSTFTQPDYEYRYGTSMAAPYVSGIMALYIQAYPELTNKEIRQIAQGTAYDLGDPGKDNSYGYGLIQAPVGQSVFVDVSINQWYADEISYLYEKGIVTGYDNLKFRPNQPVTRAEAITMIGRALGYDVIKSVTRYPDVSSDFYASGYIEKASEEQIINGFPNGTFQPNTSIIRGDVAVMLQRAYRYTASITNGFSDVQYNMYYSEPIYALLSNQISEGYPNKTFGPQKSITRAEFSVFLARVLDESFR